MQVIMHPPGDVSFSGDPLPAGEQARISRALRMAVQQAIETAARDAAPATGADPARSGDGLQAFDPARAAADGGAYLVPSYQNAGRLTSVALGATDTAPDAAVGFAVTEGPSPVDGKLILSLPGMNNIFLRGPRYATAGSLTGALELGQAIFGTTSFAILHGPAGAATRRYWAVGTDPSVSESDLGRQAQVDEASGSQLPQEIAGHTTVTEGRLYTTVVSDHREYEVLGLVTRDRGEHWSDTAMAARWYGKLREERGKRVTGPPLAAFRDLVFARINQLVAAVEGGHDDQLEAAAKLLSRLDRHAFSLVGWETKVRYLKILLAAWTLEEEEVAVVEIFASLDNGEEVDAVVAMLRQAGRYHQLFDDLDSEVYSLLTTVGECFPRDHGPLTLGGFLGLLASMGQSPVPGASPNEAYDAVMGLVRFGADLGESLFTLVRHPIRTMEGLAQLLLLAGKANAGSPEALAQIAQLFVALGEKVLAGLRGADRLGCGPKIVSRLKWRLVWEIASFFVGAGEIKAVIEGAGAAMRLPAVARFLGILARLGEAAEAERDGTRLARLAALLAAERPALGSAGEAAELLSRLPDRDVARLGRLLAAGEVKDGETLAGLAGRASTLGLGTAVEDAVAKAELLKALAAKAGGLTDEVAVAFGVLVGDDGLGLTGAQAVITALGDGEGGRFAAMLRRIHVGAMPAGERVPLLTTLAASPRRMDAVAELGGDAFAAVYRRAGGRGEALDGYLATLGGFRQRMAGQGGAGDFRRLLDRLAEDDPAAWLELEGSRRAEAGQRVISGWAEQLSGQPRAQHGLSRLLQRNQEHLVDQLIEDLTNDAAVISRPEVVQGLEEIAGMSEAELDGMAELQRYMDRDGAGEYPMWDDIVFAEPVRRQALLEQLAGLRDPSGGLAVRDGMGQVITAALGESGGALTGGLGHLETARALLRDFPGARLRFEVMTVGGGLRRDVDIVVEMTVAGRQVDVEVKAYEAGTGIGGKVREQIGKDLRLHLADPGGPWSDLLWRFPDPGYASRLPAVERAFTEELEKLMDDLRLPAAARDQARRELESRLTATGPWKLIDVLR